ncbi:MAG: murein biosynthesis integral membrane protein MurJ [Terriglobales bacterium]
MADLEGRENGIAMRFVRLFLPSREHSVLSAAALLMVATMLSRVVGYLRDAYVAYAFGAGPVTDAYVAAFTLPDLINHLASGGAISISFIAIYTRYIAQQREEEASHAFSVIVSVLGVGLGLLVLAAIAVAPAFVAVMFPEFTAEQKELCINLTRILLPAQLFFVLGGVVAAVQQTRRQFFIPAFAPIIYTLFIIGGGVLFGRRWGIAALAVGAVTGSFAGPFLMNALGAARTGISFRFRFQPFDPAFREWFRMSIPLMLGVSVILADDWIMRYFASGDDGAITRINYAKRLLQVPAGMLGQAAGIATLPFFARLYSENKFNEYAATVNNSITKLGALSLLASAWMVAAAVPIVDVAFRRGRFEAADSNATAVFFAWFSLALIFWSVQGIYARAFYAAGKTVAPMIAATLVTVCSIPVYWVCQERWGVAGLAVASNIAILLHTATLAILLHLRGLVGLGGLDWRELGKALAVTLAAYALGHWAGAGFEFGEGRWLVLGKLAMISLTWAAAVMAGLWLTLSSLLKLLRR